MISDAAPLVFMILLLLLSSRNDSTQLTDYCIYLIYFIYLFIMGNTLSSTMEYNNSLPTSHSDNKAKDTLADGSYIIMLEDA